MNKVNHVNPCLWPLYDEIFITVRVLKQDKCFNPGKQRV